MQFRKGPVETPGPSAFYWKITLKVMSAGVLEASLEPRVTTTASWGNDAVAQVESPVPLSASVVTVAVALLFENALATATNRLRLSAQYRQP
jgi:hypothetical protein